MHSNLSISNEILHIGSVKFSTALMRTEHKHFAHLYMYQSGEGFYLANSFLMMKMESKILNGHSYDSFYFMKKKTFYHFPIHMTEI